MASVVAIRLRPKLRGQIADGNDFYYHIRLIHLIRETGDWFPIRDPRKLGPGEARYPSLYHSLLSLLPSKFERRVDIYSGLVFDLISALLMGLLMVSVGGQDVRIALFAVGLYIIAPALTFAFIGPRPFSLTPRNFAQLCFSGCVAMLILQPMVTPAIAMIFEVMAIFFVALVFLSSKFGTQHVIFVLPLTAIIASSVVPFRVLSVAFILATVVSRGRFLGQIETQIRHLKWFSKKNKAHFDSRGNWLRLFDYIVCLKLIHAFQEVVLYNPILAGIARNILLFFALLMFHSKTQGLLEEGAADALLVAFALSASALVPWVMSSFGPFRALGEPERYLEFAFPAYWFLLWSEVDTITLPWLCVFATLYFAIYYKINLGYVIQDLASRDDTSRLELVQWINKGGYRRIICTDITEHNFILANTDAAVCQHGGHASDSNSVVNFLQLLLERFPYVSPERLSWVCDEYDLDAVLIKRSSEVAIGAQYNLVGFQGIHENESYKLLVRCTGSEPIANNISL